VDRKVGSPARDPESASQRLYESIGVRVNSVFKVLFLANNRSEEVCSIQEFRIPGIHGGIGFLESLLALHLLRELGAKTPDADSVC